MIRSLALGSAQVSVINIGDIHLPLADHMTVSRGGGLGAGLTFAG